MHSSRMRTVRSSSRLPGGGVCLSACWDTHPRAWAWAWTPPCAWAWTPPWADTPPPRAWAWTPLGRPPGWTPCENITFPQLRLRTVTTIVVPYLDQCTTVFWGQWYPRFDL